MTERIRERADGALRKIEALLWFWRSSGPTASTLNRVKQVIESQRDEILALNAYIDDIEKRE